MPAEVVNSQKVSLEKNTIHKHGSCLCPTAQMAAANIELRITRALMSTFADIGSILESSLLVEASSGDEF